MIYYLKLVSGEEIVSEVASCEIGVDDEDKKVYLKMTNPFVITFNTDDRLYRAYKFMPLLEKEYILINPAHVIVMNSADEYLIKYYVDFLLNQEEEIKGEEMEMYKSNTGSYTLH